MTPDQHARIKQIFLAACAEPAEKRSAFASRACGGDEQLFREVERLLAHHAAAPATEDQSPAASRPSANTRASDISALPTYETGDLVVDRYRIVSLLGEGAMGRVYRAEDDRLQQPVALKFLPRMHVLDPSWRRRVENEVRLAREVSHPNICRVYDLGAVDGAPFISMEYVDGEDLASLLRRVGRLTDARAIDIARQICAGLAAAHVHGVRHRDLKPANVMIDQKGRVRITDFGLAAMAGHVARSEIRAGTPRYMSPEQLAGVAVNEKSDIYSLGLVLYEMFTGRPAFDAENALEYLRIHETAEPVPPSTIVPEIDPKVEAVILACLRKDPAERPDSALSVAAALPGGDLLAAALDAGQIPTREMLAKAAAQGRIDRRGVVQLAAATLALLVLAVLLGRNTHPIASHGGVQSPEVLLEKAREIARSAGYTPNPRQSDGRYYPAADARFLSGSALLKGGELRLTIPPDAELLYFYRDDSFASRPPGNDLLTFLMPGSDPFAFGSLHAPSTTMILDGRGRLLFFESSPNQPFSDAAAPDWHAMIRAAGHDPLNLQPAKSRLFSSGDPASHPAFLLPADTATVPETRIEIALSDARVQFFAVLSPALAPPESTAITAPTRWTMNRTLRNIVLLVVLAVALPAAWRNWKNKGDLNGAVRLGGFVSLLRLLGDLFSLRRVHGPFMAVDALVGEVVGALCEGMVVAMLYLAIESQIRRLWPRVFGSWSILLAGRLRDPFVGRDVLFGCLVGIFWAILTFLDRRLPIGMDWETHTPLRLYQGLDDLRSARFAIAGTLSTLQGGIYQGLVLLFLLVCTTWLANTRRWLAILLTWLIGTVMFSPLASNPVSALTIFGPGVVAIGIYVVMRWGLVSLVSAIMVASMLISFPITTDLNAWFASYAAFAVLTTIAIGLWSLYESLRPPPLEIHPTLAR